MQGTSNVDNARLGISECVFVEMNVALDRPFTVEDIYKVLQSMEPLKELRVDSIGVIFYQRFWHVIGGDMAWFCVQILQGDIPVHSINHMHIMLISKVKNPRIMVEFRPICLCNVIYKIASKALVN